MDEEINYNTPSLSNESKLGLPTPEAPGPDELEMLEFDNDNGLGEETILRKLKKYNGIWDTYSTTLFARYKNNYQAYAQQSYNVEGVSVKIASIFRIIETEIPHLLNSIFSHSEIIDASPKYQDPNLETTYKIKSFINKLIIDIDSGRKKTELLLKSFLIYGTAFARVIWDDSEDKDIDPISKEVVSVDSSHANFRLPDIFSVAYDPSYKEMDIKGIPWIRERIYIDKNEMLQMRDNGQTAQFNEQDMQGKAGKDQGADVRGNSVDKLKDSNNDSADKKTYYDEFFCTLYSKDPESGKSTASEYKIWLLANNKIIKFQKNRYTQKPWLIVRCYENPDEFTGMGEPDVIGAIASQLSYAHYQSGKMVKKLGQSLTFIGPSANISPANLKRIEQGVLFVSDINAIKTEAPIDATNVKVLMEYIQYLDGNIESVTGITKMLSGDDEGDPRMTATESSLLAQNATNRLALKLIHLQEDFIVPLAKLLFMFTKQLLQESVEFFDANNTLITLAPQDLLNNYDFTPVGSISMANKQVHLETNAAMLKQLIEAATASSQTPKPFSVDILQFIKDAVIPYANIENPDRFLIDLTPSGPTPASPGIPAPVTPAVPVGQPNLPSPQKPPESTGGPQPLAQANIQGGNR